MRSTTALDCHRVFTYGTLRAGEANAPLLARAVYCGEYSTPPSYRLFDTGYYPAALAGGRTAIVGEIYAIASHTLARLDRLEGYPQLYTRQRINTDHGNAWIYLWVGDVDPAWAPIDGDWCRHRRRHHTRQDR